MANLLGRPIAGRFVAVQAAGDQKRGAFDARVDNVVGILPLGLLGDQPVRAADFTSSRTREKRQDEDDAALRIGPFSWFSNLAISSLEFSLCHLVLSRRLPLADSDD